MKSKYLWKAVLKNILVKPVFTNELIKALLDDGIEIKGPTLNRYLCEYQKIHGEEQNANPQETEKKALNAINSPLPW